MADLLEISGEHLGIDEVFAVAAAPGTEVRLSESAGTRMIESQRLLGKLLDDGRPVYGVTTGLGDSVHKTVDQDGSARLQRALIASYLNGTGPSAAPELVRATMLVRANCLARGDSAIAPSVVRRMLELLRHDVLPVVPERGSVGASGDLVQLCYLAAPLVGEGRVMFRGDIRSSHDALAALGISPLELTAKDTISLVNGTSFSTALAALTIAEVDNVGLAAELCTGLAAEALLGSRGDFAAFIHERKPHPGQVASAARIRAQLTDSRLSVDAGTTESAGLTQNRYSIRCAPHALGVLWDTTDWIRRWVETEINSSNDNPLFDPLAEAVHSGGNFYCGHIAQAMDALKPALANIADLLDRQLALLVDVKFSNGLTPNLIPHELAEQPQAALHHGFKGLQIAASALTAEALKLCAPASVFSRSTESHMEDKVTMSAIAARDARQVLILVREVAAMHLVAVSQAVELRGAHGLAQRSRAVLNLVRTRVSPLSGGRALAEDIAAVVGLISSGELARAAGVQAR